MSRSKQSQPQGDITTVSADGQSNTLTPLSAGMVAQNQICLTLGAGGVGMENSLPASYKVKRSESHSVMSDSLRPCGLYSPWNSPGQNTGGGSISLLQRIFPTQGSNPGLHHCRQILYQLSHKGSPQIRKTDEPKVFYVVALHIGG